MPFPKPATASAQKKPSATGPAARWAFHRLLVAHGKILKPSPDYYCLLAPAMVGIGGKLA